MTCSKTNPFSPSTTLSFVAALLLAGCAPPLDGEDAPDASFDDGIAADDNAPFDASSRATSLAEPEGADAAASRPDEKTEDPDAPPAADEDPADDDEPDNTDEDEAEEDPDGPAQVPPVYVGDLSLGTDAAVASFCADGFDTIQGTLRIREAVTDTTGVSCLISVSGDLQIEGAMELVTIEPFTALRAVGGDVRIASLPALDWADPFPVLESIDGSLSIESLANARVIDGMWALRSAGAIAIRDNASAELITAAANVGKVAGDVALVWNPEAAQVRVYGNAEHIAGAVIVEGMRSLEEFPPLDGAVEIGGLEIIDNGRMVAISAAAEVAEIAGDVRIEGNAALQPEAIEEFLVASADVVLGQIAIGDNGSVDEPTH